MSLDDDLKAIKPLFSSEWVISLLKACRTMNEGRADHQEWIDAAIRLLEAAEKVTSEDRQWAETMLIGEAETVMDLLASSGAYGPVLSHNVGNNRGKGAHRACAIGTGRPRCPVSR